MRLLAEEFLAYMFMIRRKLRVRLSVELESGTIIDESSFFVNVHFTNLSDEEFPLLYAVDKFDPTTDEVRNGKLFTAQVGPVLAQVTDYGGASDSLPQFFEWIYEPIPPFESSVITVAGHRDAGEITIGRKSFAVASTDAVTLVFHFYIIDANDKIVLPPQNDLKAHRAIHRSGDRGSMCLPNIMKGWQ